jgi:hypothetical protein
MSVVDMALWPWSIEMALRTVDFPELLGPIRTLRVRDSGIMPESLNPLRFLMESAVIHM